MIIQRQPADLETQLAVGEIVQAAAHAYGLTGPVQYTVCLPADLSEPPASAGGQFDGPAHPSAGNQFLSNKEALDAN